MTNNKLIAEFMGYEIVYRPYSNGFIKLAETELCDVDDLEYHTEWNWLMPVVNKCYTSNMQHPNDDITQGLIDVDIEATYKAVVEFIQEYNNEKENEK